MWNHRAAGARAIFGSLVALALTFATVGPAYGQAAAKGASGAKTGDKEAPGRTGKTSKTPAKPKTTTKSAKPKPAPKASSTKQIPRKPGSEPGEPDEATRRVIAGTAGDPVPTAGESTELAAMRAMDLALFPKPSSSPPWPTEDPFGLDAQTPSVEATGLPPPIQIAGPSAQEAALDLSWLRTLAMPDIPVRWDARVVRYLDYYKNNPKGRSSVAVWMKKSGRYAASIRKTLREHGAPEDLLWLSLVESGFNPTIHSPAGAAGLWQFMPEGARIYGLTVNRWVDERLDPERSTVAGVRYLSDLRQRFGTWELAFAAYNMGYGGLLAAIRKYNTNDYWELSHFEAGMPYETALYVPKIVALAIVARNRAAFGCDVELDPPVAFDAVSVGSGISVKTVANAAGVTVETIEDLNPQLLAKRTPPLPPAAREERSWVLRVPPGAGARAAKGIPDLARKEGQLRRYALRYGESLEDVAALHDTTKSELMSLNGLGRHEVIRPTTVLFVPRPARATPPPKGARDVVVVPAQSSRYADRKRLFYKVMKGDSVSELAGVFRVAAGDLARWNAIDQAAALHEGMTLQVYVPPSRDLSAVRVQTEEDVMILAAGSTEFFDYAEEQKGRKRVEITVAEGDTWRSIASRYGLSVGSVERINMRSRRSELSPGEKLIVYVPSSRLPREEKPAPSDEPEVAVVAPKADDDAKVEDDAKADSDAKEDAEATDDEPKADEPDDAAKAPGASPQAP